MTQHSTITQRHIQFEWHKQADLTRIRGTGQLTTPTFKHASHTHIQAPSLAYTIAYRPCAPRPALAHTVGPGFVGDSVGQGPSLRPCGAGPTEGERLSVSATPVLRLWYRYLASGHVRMPRGGHAARTTRSLSRLSRLCGQSRRRSLARRLVCTRGAAATPRLGLLLGHLGRRVLLV